jgi:hypothetical protein
MYALRYNDFGGKVVNQSQLIVNAGEQPVDEIIVLKQRVVAELKSLSASAVG